MVMKKVRLLYAYAVPGFHPLRAIIDDYYPKTRVVLLHRYQKKTPAPSVDDIILHITIIKSAQHETCPAVIRLSSYVLSTIAYAVIFAVV